jgi:hypothetical protein
MSRAAIVLAVVSALCLGVALGFMGGVMFSHHMMRRGPAEFGLHGGRMAPPGPRGMPSPRMILPRLKRLLDLTPRQSDAIRAEIERSRGDFGSVRDSLRARIERHLTPEQRERWRRATREHDPGGFAPHHLPGEPGREGEDSP